jgi:ABC-2 type transport system permease protein
MNKTFIIFRHEFIHMIRRTGFIVLTLAIPVLALLGIGIYQVVSRVATPPAQETNIGYVDGIGGYNSGTKQGNVTLMRYDDVSAAATALLKGDIKEYFMIPADYVSTGVIQRFTLDRELAPPAQNSAAIQSFLMSNLLTNEDPQVVARAKSPMILSSTRLDSNGNVASEQGGLGTFVIPYAFSLLLVMSIFFSSGYLLQGLGEEKENRIMEILLSSISSRQLLTGKILGLGAAGLIQIFVWLGSASLLLPMASSSIGGFISSLKIPPNFLVLGIIYFILGYLLFAVISAGVGAVSPTARDAQQVSALFTVIAVIPFYFMPIITTHPGSPVATVLTLFPVTAPVTVMARLGISDIHFWEIAVSILLMIGFIVGGIWLASKIFRTYLLMYGKRPGLNEIIKGLRS